MNKEIAEVVFAYRNDIERADCADRVRDILLECEDPFSVECRISLLLDEFRYGHPDREHPRLNEEGIFSNVVRAYEDCN